MEDFVGEWGLYPWFPEAYGNLVAASDISKFRRIQPHGKVFQCVGQDQEFLILRYKEEEFRVMPAIFRVVPAPRFSFGTRVRSVDRPEIIGTVAEIHWHHKQNTEMYFLEIGGKLKSSRYLGHELVTD